ncbi:MAG: biotin--[acetyl-CoA-carboxylase] ligase [Clostridiales bacterium]|nr:biotin--[acetyl-CoA-carboxylase] ligase [Clostridiales bacterium]
MRDKILALLRENGGFVSGQEISESFGVSRTSIWKSIKALGEQGYKIEAVRNKGYRLISEPDIISENRIREYLSTKWAGQQLLIMDSMDSTNNEAKRRAEAGADAGLLVIAEEQTGGRGRRGRSWDSKKGEGIFMSLLLRPDIDPMDASMLTLVMGLAVRDALFYVSGIDCLIKWPNDVVISGKKVCGILTEMSGELTCINHIVIGVGINVHNTAFPEEVSHMATSIFMEVGRKACRAQLIAECMGQFEKYYDMFMRTHDLSVLADSYNAVLVNCGRCIRVMDGNKEYIGVARGINNRGELIAETGDGIKNIISGEVSVRGVYGYV